MGTIEILYMGKDLPDWQHPTGSDMSFEEWYQPVVSHLLELAASRDIVHTVPGGPKMASAVRQMIQKAEEEQQTSSPLPFDMTPIIDVMAALRGDHGCPWDKAQTHSTLRRFLLEEVYELLDAIDQHDTLGIREELGDVLYQVVIHARIA